nr:class F sortase [Haloechinothrix aidingensis]
MVVSAGVAAVLAVAGIAAVAIGVLGGSDASTTPSAGSAVTERPTTAPDSQAAPGTAATVGPERIEIPSLGVAAPIMDLGLQADGSLEVPPGAERAGWYTGAPVPGEIGPAIVAAHVNWEGEDGPFAALDELGPGDRVVVVRDDDTEAVFQVDRVEQYAKDRFPTEQVYGDIDHAGLRLITCGGAFDSEADSYEDNVIAYASLVRTASS